MKFKHGQRVTCKIKNVQIDDAKIRLIDGQRPFICQNKQSGSSCSDNKLGYLYSWILQEDFTEPSVTDLKPFKKSFDYPEVGDEYTLNSGESSVFVLGVTGKVIFISSYADKERYGYPKTAKALRDDGYTIVQDKEERIEELTMLEVCKELGREVKIKK